MNTYQCERCERIVTDVVSVPFREPYPLGDGWVPHDYVEYRCQCGGSVETVAACSTCGLVRACPGLDDCLPCAVASMVHGDWSEIDSLRRIHAGTAWLRHFNREVERQMSALIATGTFALRQAS